MRHTVAASPLVRPARRRLAIAPRLALLALDALRAGRPLRAGDGRARPRRPRRSRNRRVRARPPRSPRRARRPRLRGDRRSRLPGRPRRTTRPDDRLPRLPATPRRPSNRRRTKTLYLRRKGVPGRIRGLQVLVHAHELHGQQRHPAPHQHHEGGDHSLRARDELAGPLRLLRRMLGIAHLTTAQIAITEEMTHNATGTIS
jgi:hypothetical protein